MENPRLPDRSKRREGSEQQEAWHVVEVFSEAKTRGEDSEDSYLITDNCILLFDGVSTPGHRTIRDDLTPAEFAVQTVREAVAQKPDLMAEELVPFITKTLRDALPAYKLPGTPSFVFVAFFPKENRIVRVGDCSYLIDGVGYNPGLNVDRAKATSRKRTHEKNIRDGATEDQLLGREMFSNLEPKRRMSSLRNWQVGYANNPDALDYGYGVIDGRDVPERFVEYVSVPAGTKSVVLASDGYPPSVLRDSLAETETALRALERHDPLGIKEAPSTRPYARLSESDNAADDRTFIKIAP